MADEQITKKAEKSTFFSGGFNIQNGLLKSRWGQLVLLSLSFFWSPHYIANV